MVAGPFYGNLGIDGKLSQGQGMAVHGAFVHGPEQGDRYAATRPGHPDSEAEP